MGYKQDSQSQELIKLTYKLSKNQKMLVLNLVKYLVLKKESEENDKGDGKCV